MTHQNCRPFSHPGTTNGATTIIAIIGVLLLCFSSVLVHGQDRPRVRESGVVVGVLPTGPYNSITDVRGVAVGHSTVVAGDSVNTGVTAILPHRGNVFENPVHAAIYVANGYGKLLGIAQVQELGVIETPILLTCTLCVWTAADALTDTLLQTSGMENVRSINPVVGETNDGYLNDIRTKPVTAEHVREALRVASSGVVPEGSVGAGRGTVAFGWKGGIGTSSRLLQMQGDTVTVGVLVQSNFGGVLSIGGAPVGIELDRYAFRGFGAQREAGSSGDGSIMIVVAVDAPVDSRQLQRIARRAMLGVGRAGGAMTNGSGDFVIAFATPRHAATPTHEQVELMSDSELSPLFQAAAEATEEAIYNSMFKATSVDGHRGTIEALDLGKVLPILRKYGVVN
jgi:D-aminopeptidase